MRINWGPNLEIEKPLWRIDSRKKIKTFFFFFSFEEFLRPCNTRWSIGDVLKGCKKAITALNLGIRSF